MCKLFPRPALLFRPVLYCSSIPSPATSSPYHTVQHSTDRTHCTHRTRARTVQTAYPFPFPPHFLPLRNPKRGIDLDQPRAISPDSDESGITSGVQGFCFVSLTIFVTHLVTHHLDRADKIHTVHAVHALPHLILFFYSLSLPLISISNLSLYQPLTAHFIHNSRINHR